MPERALRELRTELRRLGYYKRPTGRMLLELGINVLLAAGGFIVFIENPSWLIRACGLIVWTAGSIGIGTNTHTSSHHATSCKRWVNQLLTYLGYPLYFGLSATYWWHKHVQVHHSAPNVIGVDGDADLSPWFATTTDEVRKSRGLARFYYLYLQQFVFPAAISLTLFSQQIAGCVHVARSLRSRHRLAIHYIDAVALIAHIVFMLAIPMFFFPPFTVVVFYVARSIAISYAMFSIFAPAHLLADAARLSKDAAGLNYVHAVTATTLNFRMGRLGRLMCAGLEYQIEHHLLPDISYVHLPAISAMVEQLCTDHGLPYRQYRWEFAIWRSLTAIRKPCEVVQDASALGISCATPEGSSRSG